MLVLEDDKTISIDKLLACVSLNDTFLQKFFLYISEDKKIEKLTKEEKEVIAFIRSKANLNPTCTAIKKL